MTTPRGEDPVVPHAVYQRVADYLRQRIAHGELEPGDQVPTEKQLMEQYDISRGTARRAVDQLVYEGLVEIRRPSGTFVRERRPMIYRPQSEFRPAPSPEMDRFMAELSGEGRTPSQTIDVALVKPPRDVAERLRTTEPVVVLRRRTRSIDGEPYNINDSFYPKGLVEGSEIMLPVDIARGASQVLAELGALQVLAIDEIYVRMPNPDEVHRLALARGTPVAVHICTGYTADDTPVRCVVNVLPGDRHMIVFERRRPVEEPAPEA
jgi:DNA-binding GntR family transcriptional regulator